MIRRLREGKDPSKARFYANEIKLALDNINDLTKYYSGDAFSGYLYGTKLYTAIYNLNKNDMLTDVDAGMICYLIDEIMEALNTLSKQIGNCNRKLDKNIEKLGEICDKYRDEDEEF